MPGPVPKREAELQRPRDRKGGDQLPVLKGELMEVRNKPDPDPNWHSIATMVYEAAANSGQSYWYQESDWAMLYSLCDDLSYLKNQDRRSGQFLATVMSGLESLLLTEGDRRRARIELHAPEQKKADLAVVGMEAYRARAQGQKTS